MATFSLIHRYTYLGEECQNNYIFANDVGGGASATLNNAFQVNVVPLLAAFQSDNVTYGEVIIQNLDDPLDFGEFANTQVSGGAVTGAPLPSTLTFRTKLNRPRSDVKNGYKRWAGVTAGQVSQQALNTPTQASIVTLNDLLFNGFQNDVQTDTYSIRYIATPRGTTTPLVLKPTSLSVRGLIGTQNSRKAY